MGSGGEDIPIAGFDSEGNPKDRPRKLLPDMDAIDEMVKKGTKVIEEVQEILDDLRSQGGIEISVTPQGPTQVSVSEVKINVPLRKRGAVL